MAETESDDLVFLDDEAPAATEATPAAEPWAVLIADDDEDVHRVTRAVIVDIVFQGRGISVLHAYSGAEAQRIIASHPGLAVVLLDVVMETEDAGLRAVRHVREVLGNANLRIILRTGQPGQAPERDVITGYDINDYKSKTELTAQKLFTTLIAALRAYQGLMEIAAGRDGLRHIADASGDLFRLRDPASYAARALAELAAFAGASGGGLFVRESAGGGALRTLALLHWQIADEADMLAELREIAQSGETRLAPGRLILCAPTPEGRTLFAILAGPAPLTAQRESQLRLFAAKIAIGYDNVVMHEFLSQTNRWLEEQVAARTRELSDKTARLEIAQRRMAEELKLASVLQQSILPHEFPPLPGLAIAAAMEPANQVGGDFYQVLPQGPGEMAFLVADVSGKGVPAAFFMLRAHGLLTEIAAAGHSPAQVLRQANLRLCESNPLSLFVTLFYGVLDIRTGRLAYANAGHEMPLLHRKDGTLAPLPRPKGMLLGIIEEAVFAEAGITLEAGDRLFLFTDGVTEAMDTQGALFGDDRLAAALATAPPGVQDAMAHILAQVRHFAAGAGQADDITCMLLGVSGAGDVAA